MYLGRREHLGDVAGETVTVLVKRLLAWVAASGVIAGQAGGAATTPQELIALGERTLQTREPTGQPADGGDFPHDGA